MTRKKHESSLLEVFSDVGSTPTASTNYTFLISNNLEVDLTVCADLCSRFEVVILEMEAFRLNISSIAVSVS